MTRALVTGSAGFIGSRVVRRLLAAGHHVRALHLPGDNLENLAGLAVELVPGDVTDLDSLRAAVTGAEVVFHLAALYALWLPDPGRLHAVNVDGTRNVLRAAREAGVRRVVHTSSIARFGGQGAGRRATEASPFALGVTGDRYAQSKADAHEVAVAAAAAGQDVVIVAPTGPLGPGDIGPTPTGRVLRAALTWPFALVTPGVSNFAHVDDIAAGHLLAAERGERGESYLLGGEDVALPELARRALASSGRGKPIVTMPPWVVRLAAHGALAWSEHVSRAPPLFTPAAARIAELGLAADCTKARTALGYDPRPIDRAIEDAVTWFARRASAPRRVEELADVA